MGIAKFNVSAPKLSMAQMGELAAIFPDLELIDWSLAYDLEGYSTGEYDYEFLKEVPDTAVDGSDMQLPHVVLDVAEEITSHLRHRVTSGDVQALRAALQPLYEAWLNSVPNLSGWRTFAERRSAAWKAQGTAQRQAEQILSDTVYDMICRLATDK